MPESTTKNERNEAIKEAVTDDMTSIWDNLLPDKTIRHLSAYEKTDLKLKTLLAAVAIHGLYTLHELAAEISKSKP